MITLEIIRVQNLCKNYGNLKAVHNVSFSIPQGSIFGILGPNGAGKTTTIECMVGLKTRTSGVISILELDPEHNRRELFSLVGVQLQETSYHNNAKVQELCQLFSSMYTEPLDYRQLLQRMEEAAILCDQICLINHGQIVVYDTVDGVIKQAGIDLVISLETDVDLSPYLSSLANIKHFERSGVLTKIYTDSEQTLSDLVLRLRETGIPYRKIKIAYPELEDAFLKLISPGEKGAVS